MSIEIWTEAVATPLEIASFFFVTFDLFGRDNVERKAIALRDRTRDSFYNSFLSDDDGSVWRNVFGVTVIILIAIAAVVFIIHAVHVDSAMFAKSQTGRGHHPDWREFFLESHRTHLGIIGRFCWSSASSLWCF
jgi:hypothetical protein